MFFHVILTSECNSQCRYCFGEAIEDFEDGKPATDIDYSLPRNLNYDVSMLANFCALDPDCTLTFYGGEPLLLSGKIEEIMDTAKAGRFMIQTNGLLLDSLDPSYVNRLHTILVSIDGDEQLTDFYRGPGTFKKVIGNLKLIRRRGFKGELIARMTVMEQTDIYRQVTWLLNNDQFAFTSVHWQLNAGFWKNDFARRDFKRWSEVCYNPGIKKLVKFWTDSIENDNVVLRLYPILGVAQSFLKDEESSLRCGGGWINYAIQTDGNIIPCPTMWGMRDHYLGHIRNGDPLKLRKTYVGKPCSECHVFRICGGRCLYANVVKRWDTVSYSVVCDTVKNLIDSIREQMPRVKKLMESGRINTENFNYVKYNGCEIIP